MAPDVLAHIFDPFFTTKEHGKGTGLGLSMVYGFIKQSKGHIKVASVPGRGTAFRIYLPRTHEAAGDATPSGKAEVPRGHERVLVVEDEEAVRVSLVEQLRSLGYDVTHASDGASALAAVEAARPPYELLLTDVMMPGLNGKSLADAVTLRRPETRIVYMSGYAENTIVHDGVIDAGVRLLSKPFGKAELARAVRQALDATDVTEARTARNPERLPG
jgi:CheY-like chemotaxis protein